MCKYIIWLSIILSGCEFIYVSGDNNTIDLQPEHGLIHIEK